MAGDAYPTAIRALAVSSEDVVNAFVYTRENPGTAVLRVTPPFHGRMRARLHVYQLEDTRETGAVHVDPARLLEDEVVDSFPALEETEAALEADDPETVRKAHAEALEDWRDRATDAIVEEVALEGERRVEVKHLG